MGLEQLFRVGLNIVSYKATIYCTCHHFNGECFIENYVLISHVEKKNKPRCYFLTYHIRPLSFMLMTECFIVLRAVNLVLKQFMFSCHNWQSKVGKLCHATPTKIITLSCWSKADVNLTSLISKWARIPKQRVVAGCKHICQRKPHA